MKSLIAAVAVCVATTAHADLTHVLDDHIRPAIANFASASAALHEVAVQDCSAPSVIPAYHQAFDAWLGASHLTFGPIERDGRALAIAFWPDSRGAGPKALAQLIADADPVVDDPAEFAEVSVAARGFFGLEHLLYGDSFTAQDYTCRLVIAIAADLERMAGDIATDWADYAQVMTSAGAVDNTTYLAAREVDQTLYTVLLTGVEFTKDQRLGRPLGTFDRPRPTRAEARRSGRSLRNVVLSLSALRDLARAMADAPIPASEAAFDAAFDTAAALDDPIFAGVSDPTGRLRVEILQQKVAYVRDALAAEIGGGMGLSQGFNSADGD
ncbi:imelysin family protein [Marinovum sp. 2_MG-2023]|uniref:imelysin family protein n=1 Tax=unclassified Marinovum TaxID=2647166 RepID=UPI0026E149C2|nr:MULTISPECIES: imelysin family protein [unclassified Marinovum]MDO6730229.1 imelysin family protein [Marinovum sp. 2_MG-2023]MDO6778967.1 imelysin family protein [Marinovum sp. 1_MG-2023]